MSETNEQTTNNQNTASASDLDEAIRRDEEARSTGAASSETEAPPASREDEEKQDGHGEAEAKDSGTERDEAPEDDEQSKRIARLAYEARQERNRARNLEQEIARLKGQAPPLPEDEQIKQRVQREAAMLADKTQFDQRCNDIYRRGLEEYPDFDQSLSQMKAAGLFFTREVIEAADGMGNAQKTLHYLAKNPDIAEKLGTLPPHKVGVEIAKLQNKISPPKAVSKAPPPIKPIAGRGVAERSIEQMPLEDFMKQEDEKYYARRRGR